MKVVESPHRTIMHPQKDLHHNSQRMTENHPENVATWSSLNGWNKYVTISSSGCQTFESYTHEDQSSEDENSTPFS
jgi:hypothetical protein